MILKRTFRASGTDRQDVAADLNMQITEFLTGSGFFRMISVEEGEGGRPKYTLEYKDSGYLLIFQSHINGSRAETKIAAVRGVLDQNINYVIVRYGSEGNATLTLHMVVSGMSMVFKLFNFQNTVCFGGSCIRYTRFNGEQGYLYHSREVAPLLGYLGRYEIEKDKIAQISFTEYPYTQYAVIQQMPLVTVDGAAIGRADDLVVINLNSLSTSHAFSVYTLLDEEYYGGKAAFGAYINHLSACTAVTMKGESKL